MSEEWQVGDRVCWADRPGPENQGVIVQVWYGVLEIRWETGNYSRIAARSPWLKRLGRA